ncbi:MAG: hypothetical protein RJA70_4895 [Pseudomonadota bacterium]|jgi:cysteine-rich repeat protein
MKNSKSIILAALVAGAALSGCSAESNTAGSDSESFGSVQAQLRVNSNGLAVGGDTLSVGYDLSCGGVTVKTGAVPVPLSGSTVSGFFGSVRPANNCVVALSTTVKLDKDLNTNGLADDNVTCSASSASFNVGAGQLIDLGNIAIVCKIDDTADIRFAATIELMNQSLDTFVVAPLSILRQGGVVPPVGLSIKTPTAAPGVTYAWSANGGSFVGCGAAPADCTFMCEADGVFNVQLAANFGTNTLSRSVSVTCAGFGFACGNGVVEAPETCDDGNTVALDGCNATCKLEICGDGIKNNGTAEECEDGNTNDDDLCGNDCKFPVCGDGQVEGTETCDAAVPTCVNCATVTLATCGDGIVNQASEQCDTGGASATCTATCQIPSLNPLCPSCLDTNIPGGLNQACSANANCAAVRDCVVDSDCFKAGKSPSECYCGPTATIGQCSAPAFDPIASGGLCVPQIRAALTSVGQALDNANVLGVMAAAGNPSGDAFGILVPAADFGICIAECTL